MGWYVRKSFGKGPFRINISKSGIGVSAGVKGARISTNSRGTYVNLGTGGIYYRQKIGGGTKRTPSGHSNANQQRPSNENPPQNADSFESIHQSSSRILDDLNQTVMAQGKAWMVIFLATIVFFACLPFLPWLSLLSIFLFAFPVMLALKQDEVKKTYPLFYELSNENQIAFDKKNAALASLAQSKRMWSLTGSEITTAWKAHAGATVLISRKNVSLFKSEPPFIATNIDPFCLDFGEVKLYFLPDAIYILKDRRYSAHAYQDLSVSLSNHEFVEHGPLPSDALVLSRRWLHPNKDGSPDRRYSQNFQIPVVKYGLLTLLIDKQFKIELQVSSLRSSEGMLNFGDNVRDSSGRSYGQQHSRDSEKAGKSSGQNNKGRFGEDSCSGSNQSRIPRKDNEVNECYVKLGLHPDATKDEASSAYRTLALQYHPDRVAHLAKEFQVLAETRMKEINAAYVEIKAMNGW